MRFQRATKHQISVVRSNKEHLRAVRRSYGHNKHTNAIWKAQIEVKREHKGANQGDGVFPDRCINGFRSWSWRL